MERRQAVPLVVVACVLLAVVPPPSIAQDVGDPQYLVELKSREFIPGPGIEPAVVEELAGAPAGRRHVLLQLYDIPDDAQRAALEAVEITLLAYVPSYAWFASLPVDTDLQDPGLSSIRWVGAIRPEDRVAPILREPGVPPGLVDEQGQIGLDLRFFADVEAEEALDVLRGYGAVVEEDLSDFHRYVVRVAPAALGALAAEDGVQWIEPAAPPKTVENDGTRARTNVNAVQAAPYNLSGSNVDLGMWDGGKVDTHVDFSWRLTVVDTGASVVSHSTHVAGTMAGDGSASASQGGTANQWQGMAPGADIFSYYWDNNLTDHDGAVNTYGIELSQNSWGYMVDESEYNNCSLYGDYVYGAPDYDDIVTGKYGSKRIVVVFAAGNERNDCDCGMSCAPPYVNYANVGPPGTAKNILTVGGSNSQNDTMTEFSSWGPVDDGRLKPEIVAPGCEEPRNDANPSSTIWSTLPGNVYGGMCGTSMAAPAVSGISALIIQQYQATFGGDPWPSTVKALLVQTAVDLHDGTSYYNPGPDYASGYGRVDVQAAADAILTGRVRQDQISNGQTDTFYVDVPPSTPSLKVTLAWDDEPGTVNANPALVNNLDLVLAAPGGGTLYRPWILNPAQPGDSATTGIDSRNNLEQVMVNSPVAGTWEVRVVGSSVPVSLQSYSLAGQNFTSPPASGPIVHEAHWVDDDNAGNSLGNNNSVANPGETIELYIDLRNNGPAAVSDVYAVLSTADPYAAILYNTGSGYGSIAAGGVGQNVNDFDISLSSGTPHGRAIHFSLDVTASNGGPWSDDFYVVAVGGGPAPDVALISDQNELEAITPILDSMSLSYDRINQNWDGGQGIYTADSGFLNYYRVAVWYASGSTWGRVTSQREHDALEQFLQAGGRLLVTGYDTLGHPTDPRLAALVRSSSSGDGPFTLDYTITNDHHPITHGPFGSFNAGVSLRAAHSDHDQAEADAGRGANTVAELAGGRDKILATVLSSGGIVVYWNGNRQVSDWTGVLSSSQEQGEERKLDAESQTTGVVTLEDVREQAQRIAPEDLPPEANYGGSEPVWSVPPEALPRPQSPVSPQASQTVAFPATGDTVSVMHDPYWWSAGDYAQGTRTLVLNSVNGLVYNWSTTSNVLEGTGHVDLELRINGVYVGGFTVNPGEMSRSVCFSFTPIVGPVYTIRLEETNTVDSARGSIQIPLNLSTMTFYSPSTPEQVALLKNTLYWLVTARWVYLPVVMRND